MTTPANLEARLFYRAATQRLEDADYLLKGNRTTGAIYLGGYSVECILKALIIVSSPKKKTRDILGEFRGVRAHHFDWLRSQYLQTGASPIPSQLTRPLAIVNGWSTALRYQPGSRKRKEAVAFLDAAKQIVAWGKKRL